MALPTSSPNSWMQSLDLPSRLFEAGRSDYELYEEDDEFVLTVELPGFEREEMGLAWDDGVLNVSAERADDRGQRRTYHRRFRFPKTVVDEEITARYRNGILEVRLPVEPEAAATGRTIDIEG